MKNRKTLKKGILFLGIMSILTIFSAFSSIFGAKNDYSKGVDIQNIDQIPLRTLSGDTITLEKFKGKKILIVNTASKCGYTPQYEGLQKLHEQYGEKVVVIGFPTDNFLNQEYGTASEIGEFCTKNYGVTFLMMDKVDVKGKTIHPLFATLLNPKTNHYGTLEIKWNFHKILLNEEHQIVADFASGVKPLDNTILDKVKN